MEGAEYYASATVATERVGYVLYRALLIHSLIECNYDNAQGTKTWMLNFNSFQC